MAPARASEAEDLYAVLGVPRDCSTEDIKRAYRRLALQLHPDKTGGDAASAAGFTRLAFAYGVLSEPAKRRYYDATGDAQELDCSAHDFLASLQSLFAETLGGLSVADMVDGLSAAELRRMPPFPFPERLFPPGTFPKGMRFSSDFQLPPAVEELLSSGGGAAALRALWAAGGSEEGSEDSGWVTDDAAESDQAAAESSDESDEQPAAPAAAPGGVCGRRWLEAAKACDVALLSALLGAAPQLWAYRGPGLGHTALHWASARGDPATVRWLLGAPGADACVLNSAGATALHAAAGNDCAEALLLLLRAGVPPGERDHSGDTARDVAHRLGRAQALRVLDEWMAPTVQTCTAQQAPLPPMAEPPPDDPPRRPSAPDAPDAPDAPPDVGPLDRAASRAWLEAARSGDVEALSRLLAREPRLLHSWGAGSNYGFAGNSALHWAAARGHLQALRWLLAQGMHPGVCNHGGGQPLHAAAAHGATACARALILEGGAPCDARNGLEETARQVALQGGHAATAAAIDDAARLAALRTALHRGDGARALRDALAATGVDVRALSERADVLSSAQRAVEALPPLAVHPSRRVAVPPPRAPHARAGTAAPSSTADDEDSDGAGCSVAGAEAAKAAGNAAFAGREFARAVRAYSLALRLDRGNAVLLSNRSAARAASGDHAGALEDGERAVRAAPRWPKAHARKAAALLGLGQAGEAVKAYAAGLAANPEAQSLKDGLAEAKAAIRSAQARYTDMWGAEQGTAERA